MIRRDLCVINPSPTRACCQNHISARFFAQSQCLCFCNKHTEAHKLDPATVACHRLVIQAANSIIRLIVLAINFNPDMKEFGAFTLLITHIVCGPCSERWDKTHVSCPRLVEVDGG